MSYPSSRVPAWLRAASALGTVWNLYGVNGIYAAYGTSWDVVAGADTGNLNLAGVALFLGRLLVGLLPDEPEARGLLAQMLYCEARARAPGP